MIRLTKGWMTLSMVKPRGTAFIAVPSLQDLRFKPTQTRFLQNRHPFLNRSKLSNHGLEILLGNRFPQTGFSISATQDWATQIRQKNEENRVIVYSRSWCPFCSEVQQLLNSYKVDSKFIQLDNIEEGDDIQDALLDMTGSRTVPQVFIGGTFIGGCEETLTLHQRGELKPMLEKAGAEFLDG